MKFLNNVQFSAALFNSIIPLLTLLALCNSARQSKRARMMVGGLGIGRLHYLFPVENSQFSINISIFVTQHNTTLHYRKTRSVSANDMFVQFNSRKERKGNTLQGRGRGESASLSLIP